MVKYKIVALFLSNGFPRTLAENTKDILVKPGGFFGVARRDFVYKHNG
jgi:hypothetical protein